ncbi:MAG: VanW family protein [Candidatus Magasanikbacteria bacterium]|nr:VanW family protein [Candidatus Magasanikbacteria bacterium]
MDIDKLRALVNAHEQPRRKALSSQLPQLKRGILLARRTHRSIKNYLNPKVTNKKSKTFFTHVIARHQSVLVRKLGDSDINLQKEKITNLQRACEDLNGVIIDPGNIFSLWHTIGQPTHKKGYVNGMLLSNGKVVPGIGGGLCQLSNFLCWIFMHADTKIIERYHHSMDVFPDSGRVLPFGSGATCLYNFVDLKIKNTSAEPLQLKIWVTENHLKGQLVSPQSAEAKFSVFEAEHCFIKTPTKYFRYNEISRAKKINGEEISREKLFTNFAPVLYPITTEYLSKNNFTVVDIQPTTYKNLAPQEPQYLTPQPLLQSK